MTKHVNPSISFRVDPEFIEGSIANFTPSANSVQVSMVSEVEPLFSVDNFQIHIGDFTPLSPKSSAGFPLRRVPYGTRLRSNIFEAGKLEENRKF
jgi:hypothetical protein